MTMILTVDEWIDLPDNPRQRDTVSHARRIEPYLREFRSPHADVVAGRLPNGDLYKLDGHTRGLCWKENRVQRPPGEKVEAKIYDVPNMETLAIYYELFNSRLNVKTSSDSVFGATRELGISLSSPLLRRGSYITALQLAEGVSQGFLLERRDVSPHYLVSRWQRELVAVDTLLQPRTGVPAVYLAAMLLSFRKFRDTGEKFDNIVKVWKAYLQDTENDRRHPANKLQQVVEEAKRTRNMAGLNNRLVMLKKSLSLINLASEGRRRIERYRAFSDNQLRDYFI